MERVELVSLIIIWIAIIFYVIWLIMKNKLKDVALQLILEAEKNLNNGNEKMEHCIQELIKLIPMPFSLFVTPNTIRKLVQAVFDKVKALLDYQKPISLNEVEKMANEQVKCEAETNIERKEGTD